MKKKISYLSIIISISIFILVCTACTSKSGSSSASASETSSASKVEAASETSAEAASEASAETASESEIDLSGKKVIACIGDSLTYGVIPKTAGEQGVNYPEVLAGLLGDDYAVLNLGKPGHTLTEAGVCYLKRPEYQQSIDVAADMYIIMLGTNDSNLHEKWDAEAFEADLDKVVATYKEARPDTKIVLIAPPTVYPDADSGEISMDLSLLETTIRDIVKQTSEKYDTLYIDMFAATTENPDWIGEDGIHFTQEGYEAFGQLVYENIKDSLDA